jgi:Transposase DDE domain
VAKQVISKEGAMRSRHSHTISSGEVHQWVLDWLLQAKLLKDHGWLCTAAVVWSVVLRAAARSISVCAACCDLANAPSDQAVLNALGDGLPKTLPVLEGRLNEALTAGLAWRMRRRCWEVAIDWHLSPYYGLPHKSRNELYYGKPRQGTKRFHAYATACIVSYGHRYTIALSWVRRHETTVTVLRRLLATIGKIGLKIRLVYMDRAFFNLPVVEFLQAEDLPFVMPVMFRGRPPKKGRKPSGLQWIKRQAAGWYEHVMKNKQRQATVGVCVGYRRHRNPKDGKQRRQKLLFATWRVKGSPTEIRQRYRLRFGIETSYRQMRQARIHTCTRNPHLRLVFVAVALILRNLWVWIHLTHLAEGDRTNPTMHLERLRFKRMLSWIIHTVSNLLHDDSELCVKFSPM